MVNDKLKKVGCIIPNILIPNKETDLFAWSCIACDQFTSDREYWNQVHRITHGKDSTYHLTFPEVYLNDGDAEKRINDINWTMNFYKNKGTFVEHKNTLVLVKRTSKDGNTRWGLMLALDLEKYDYNKGSKSLIRATEETITSRIPPRVKIREKAILETPHIVVFIDDKNRTIIEPLVRNAKLYKQLYYAHLMQDGGQVSGWEVSREKDLEKFADAFTALYESLNKKNPLLFAMGDGNHSFATAKQCWENIKITLTDKERENHPARYCLVEVQNIHNRGIKFEPIHRIFYSYKVSEFDNKISTLCKSYKKTEVKSLYAVKKFLSENKDKQVFAIESDSKYFVYLLQEPKGSIASSTIQNVIDSSKNIDVDYIHGIDVVDKLGKGKNDIGIFMPDISKKTFFSSILKDGSLPRKTFSIGKDKEKRYYFEARYIV